MRTYTCINKIRDNNNIIKQYVLKDIQTHTEFTVGKDELKAKISTNQVSITNLRIDSNGRLVDKANEEPSRVQETPRRLQDMTNKELYDYIKTLENSSKTSNSRLLSVIREIYNRCINTDNIVEQILQQMESENHSNTNESSLSNQINAIQSYLSDNADNLEQIKRDISNLNTQLQSISGENETETPKLLTDNGEFEIPSDVYSKFFYEQYFDAVATNNIPINNDNIISFFKEELEKAYKAYTETESFYMAQLNDYTNYNQTQFFSAMTDAISDRFKEIVGASPEIVTGMSKEIAYAMAKIIPPIEKSARYKKAKNDFGNKPEISKAHANDIMKEIGGIWNNAISFITDNEEWEIMLYVIQTLNHSNLRTFSIATGIGYNAVENENGEMKKYMDDTFTGKKSKALTETALFAIYKQFNERGSIRDKIYECEKLVYDRFIVSYFAAKKVLYPYRLYPFGKNATPQINGLAVKLIETGLSITNVKSDVARQMLTTFCYSNNQSKNCQYHIDTNVDINNYIPGQAC